MATKIENALRDIALCYAAHEPMHPASPKWVSLAKLIEPDAEPKPVEPTVAIEFRERDEREPAASGREEDARGYIAQLEQALRQTQRDLAEAKAK